jgi:spore maturation protein CgeB
MHLVIFGLTVSSSWGNGHATLWRSLIKAMIRRGHRVTFYERDVPYYARARDLHALPLGGKLRLYDDLQAIRGEAMGALDEADVAICTSFCPDGVMAARMILDSRATIKTFYDLDTPVTLEGLRDGGAVAYLPEDGLGGFDLVLSYTGGRALGELKTRLGARVAAPLYGAVDPENHRPVEANDQYRCALSYLGTYAQDRQETLERLFLDAARMLPREQFLIGGAQYPDDLPLAANVALLRHVPPPMHPAFFCSSRATLNVTRGVMARYGYCPSGRLFEAAACGVPLVSDAGEGIEQFFIPGRELLLVQTAEDVVDALSLGDGELARMADAARERTLAEHTGECRVEEFETICDRVRSSSAHEACA